MRAQKVGHADIDPAAKSHAPEQMALEPVLKAQEQQLPLAELQDHVVHLHVPFSTRFDRVSPYFVGPAQGWFGTGAAGGRVAACRGKLAAPLRSLLRPMDLLPPICCLTMLVLTFCGSHSFRFLGQRYRTIPLRNMLRTPQAAWKGYCPS